MTDAATVGRYSLSVRALHWLTAVLVFTALIVGFALANALADRTVLLAVHKVIGALILVITVVRIANRLRHRAPAMPSTVGRWERGAILGSEVLFYALLLAQPFLGWAMLSASGVPVVIGPIPLPPIAPVDAGLYAVLRNGHSIGAYLLVALVAAHVSAVLLHAVSLRDGMLKRMLPRRRMSDTVVSRQ
ncbi:cytochrome b [Mycobacterium sp. 21AC1]|uniref:cytochrome b n=1 Tax=[Mycobacterium] appelbergii TaxID=2939269 RepID=UPI002938EB4D|nr:cytochrome b [Mycobacterium sp. 21AC1]MDV3126601.1 cytochrome b [Mycobacterium sp. 21AC1]